MDSGTANGVGRAVWLDEALRVFSATVEIDEAEGDGQLSIELGNMDGERDWGLGLVRFDGGWVGFSFLHRQGWCRVLCQA